VRSGDDPRAEPDGDGDGNGGLGALSREELYERAQRQKVPGRTKMSKRELVEALSDE
jgi:DNA end-binding protein Ku